MAQDFLSVTTTDRQLLKDFEELPDVVRRVLKDKIEYWTHRLAELVEDNIRDRLGTKTGELENSVQVEILEDGLRINGRVYIHGVAHAKIQEQGGTTPPHVIRPREAKILAFMAATGDKVFATQVFHPGGQIPGVHYMRDAYREVSPQISNGLYEEIVRKARRKLKGQ